MSQDSRYRHRRPELVDLFDEFLVNTTLPDDDIQIPVEIQPLNPELEDEVPNQEAVNGIARATRPRDPAWRDLGLQALVHREVGASEGGDIGARLRGLNLQQRSVGPISSPARTIR